MTLPAKIITTHVYPPIPQRGFDWCAYRGDYEPDCGYPVGWGKTEQEAIDDLLDLEDDDADYAQWCEDESRRDDVREGFES
jgi:hypothetical protein